MSTAAQPLFDMSKAKPIFDMSKAQPISPAKEPEEEDALTKANRQMTAAMSGQTTLLSPEEKAQAEEGKKAGMKAAAETVGGMIGGEAFGLPALKGLTGALVRMFTTGTGAAVGNAAGQVGTTGQAPNAWESLKAGATWGAFTGAGEALSSLGEVRNSLRNLLFTAEGKYTPIGKAVAHPVDASADYAIRKTLGVPATPAGKPESVPITQSPNFNPAEYKAGVKARVAATAQTPEVVQATTKPSPIASPTSAPPPINRTLVSYDRNLLVGMARHGDVDALRELIRNPGNIDVPSAVPNAKFLLEQGAPTNIYGGPK